MRILYIEDNAPMRRAISRKIADAGYDVFQASDGVKALAAMKENIPDMVLCDDIMPNMTGRELLKEIRINHPELSTVPFVLMSARSDRSHMLMGLESGADDYLIKPVDLDLMLAKINAMTRLKNRYEINKNHEISKIYRTFEQHSNVEDGFSAIFDNLQERLEHEYEECVKLKESARKMKAEMAVEKELNRELLAKLNSMERIIDASMNRILTIREQVEAAKKCMAVDTTYSASLWDQLEEIGQTVEATIIPITKIASFTAR